MSRCSGHCCRSFSIPYSPEDIEVYKANIDEAGNYAPEFLLANPVLGEDMNVIAPMLVYIGQNLRVADLRARPRSGEERLDGHWYTCRHLAENGDCGIYERRPRMCSQYPYKLEECPWADCTRGAKVHLPVLGSP